MGEYSPNWVWGNNEHKVLIVGDVTGNFNQNVYFNVYADGQRGGQGRINVYLATVGSSFKAADSDPKMTPGVWHFCELHVVAGTNGRIEAKLDGVLLTLRSSPGTHNPLNVNTGPSIGYIKPDTTYNDYAYPSSLNLTMHAWYDSVELSKQGVRQPRSVAPDEPRIIK